MDFGTNQPLYYQKKLALQNRLIISHVSNSRRHNDKHRKQLELTVSGQSSFRRNAPRICVFADLLGAPFTRGAVLREMLPADDDSVLMSQTINGHINEFWKCKKVGGEH